MKMCAREKVAAHIVPNLGSSDKQPRRSTRGWARHCERQGTQGDTDPVAVCPR